MIVGGALAVGGGIALAVVLIPHGLLPGGGRPAGTGAPSTVPSTVPSTGGGSARPTVASAPPSAGLDGNTPWLPVRAGTGMCVGQNPDTHHTEVEPCGAPSSLFTVAATPGGPGQCGPGYATARGDGGYLCLTLDVRPGNCVDASLMKTDCASRAAVSRVIAVQPGPRTSASCVGVPGASQADLTGPEPAAVACVGPRS